MRAAVAMGTAVAAGAGAVVATGTAVASGAGAVAVADAALAEDARVAIGNPVFSEPGHLDF